MKKIISIIIVLSFILSAIPVFADNSFTISIDNSGLKVNGVKAIGEYLYRDNGKYLISATTLNEVLGCQIERKSKSITVKSPSGDTVSYTMGSKEYYINGKKGITYLLPYNYQNKILLPFRITMDGLNIQKIINAEGISLYPQYTLNTTYQDYLRCIDKRYQIEDKSVSFTQTENALPDFQLSNKGNYYELTISSELNSESQEALVNSLNAIFVNGTVIKNYAVRAWERRDNFKTPSLTLEKDDILTDNVWYNIGNGEYLSFTRTNAAVVIKIATAENLTFTPEGIFLK